MSTPIPPAQAPPVAVTLDPSLLSNIVAAEVTKHAATLVDLATTQATAAISDTVHTLHNESLDLITQTHDKSVALITEVATQAEAGIAANSQAIEDVLSSIGGALATTLKTSPKIQAAMILGTLGALLIGALSILIAALAGSHTANDWIGYAVGMFGTSIGGIVLHELGLLGATNPPVAVPIVATPVATPVLLVPTKPTP